jgi:hypothetical protein
MKKLILFLGLLLAFTVNISSQVYSNVLVEVNTFAELTSLNVSAPFVWCRATNTLYYFDANLGTFTPYPANTVTSVNTLTGAVTLTTANIADSLNKRYVTDAQQTVITNTSGTNTGDQNLTGLMVKANNLSDLTNVATAKTNLSLVKGDVSLGNVDNTSDVNKPVSTAQQTALNLKVNLTQPYGYMIDLQGLTSSPVDAQTIFFGNIPRAPTTTAANSQIFIRKAGTIKVAEIYCFSGTAGSNEAWSISIRLNNATDTLIQTVSSASAVRTFTNSSLSIAVAAGDYIEIKSVNPTWGTNPLTTVFGGYIYIE